MEKFKSNKYKTFNSNKIFDLTLEEDTINLCVSIFYDKLHWDILVVDAIMPFIYENKDLTFFFYLNEIRGSNIRLVFVVKKGDAANVALLIDNHFTTFLAKNQSKLTDKNDEFFQFFMNFKNNSIQYGLFEYDSDSWQDFYIGLSDLLFLFFNEYKNEFHLSINEILFQIITIFFNALKISDDQILEILRNLVENENEHQQYGLKLPQEITDLHEQYFLENKSVLLPYLKGFRNANANDYDEKWEVEWHNCVYSFYENFTLENNAIEINTALNKIMEVFSVKNKISLYYLLINAIEKYKV